MTIPSSKRKLNSMGTNNPILVLSSYDGTDTKLTHNLEVSSVSSLRTPTNLLIFTHKIGIDKYIKIRSTNKLKNVFKSIVYHGGSHLVSHVVGKDNHFLVA